MIAESRFACLKRICCGKKVRKRSVSDCPGGVVCLHGVRKTANRDTVRVVLSINKFLIVATGGCDSQYHKANFVYLLNSRCLHNV
jgi:hypothetical protein